jgi:hypothetical protein
VSSAAFVVTTNSYGMRPFRKIIVSSAAFVVTEQILMGRDRLARS